MAAIPGFKPVLLTLLAALPAAPQVTRTDLFVGGTHGYRLYRIPGIVATAQGTLLAYAEARKGERGDWGTIDIVLRRSADGGRTWSPQQVIARVPGPHAKNPVALAQSLASPGEVTYNNPVAIADRSGAVHFLFCLEYMRAFYMRSDHDGRTFTAPVEITAAFERFRPFYDWKVLATGPGHGIQLKTGRLLVPVWLSTGTGGHAHRPSVVSTIYSDDHGRSWRAGSIAVANTEEFINPSESMAVEREDGSVLLNVRSESKRHRRVITQSPDGAGDWAPPRFDEALLEPICMAGLLRLPWKDRGRPVWLFSNPDNLRRADGKEKPGVNRDRRNLTIKVSRDEGRSWSAGRVVDPGFAGYSDLTAADGWIYLLYERGAAGEDHFRPAALALVRFPLAWIEKVR